MELTLKEKVSKLVKTLEVTNNGYKVIVNTTIDGGKIENLNGRIVPSTTKEGEYVEGISFHGYKRNEVWSTDVAGASNAEHATVSALAVAAVNYVVKTYETA